METAAEMRAAMELREKDFRARRLADSAVAMALQELSDDAPEEYGSRQYAHRVAQLAAALLVSAIYINDAEISAMREERDRYKQLAEDALACSPAPFSVLTR